MKVKLSDYEHHRALFKKFILEKPEKLKLISAAEYSACVGVPMVVIYTYMIDLGLDKYNLKDRIEELNTAFEIDLIS